MLSDVQSGGNCGQTVISAQRSASITGYLTANLLFLTWTKDRREKLSYREKSNDDRTGDGGDGSLIIQADTRELSIRKHICALSQAGIMPAHKCNEHISQEKCGRDSNVVECRNDNVSNNDECAREKYARKKIDAILLPPLCQD